MVVVEVAIILVIPLLENHGMSTNKAGSCSRTIIDLRLSVYSHSGHSAFQER